MSSLYFYIVVTAAGVVPRGSRKKRPRTSSIVQFIFYFKSFEISRNILRNQKNPYILNSFNYLDPFRLMSVNVRGLSKKFVEFLHNFYILYPIVLIFFYMYNYGLISISRQKVTSLVLL